jgi:hypothetical protein
VTIASISSGRQQTPPDYLSLAMRATVLAVSASTWLRDEGATLPSPAVDAYQGVASRRLTHRGPPGPVSPSGFQ